MYMDKIKKLLDKINELEMKNDVIRQQLLVDLEYLYKKYDKKVNPKYKDKISIDNISVLVYESGINLLIKEDYNEKIFWEIIKIIIKNPNFTCIKIRKDRDFSSTSMCTAKQYTKIRSWFASNTLEYETLSVFLLAKNNESIVEEIKNYGK